MAPERSLPPSGDLDVGKLERLFDSKSASYKYLLFRSILKCLSRRGDRDGDVQLDYADLEVEMLANSWYPVHFFRLSFGWHDKLGEALEEIHSELRWDSSKASDRDARKFLDRESVRARRILRRHFSIETMVVYRLLSPWFADLIRGKIKNERNRTIDEASRRLFGDRKPLYRIEPDSRSVVLHPEWVGYLEKNRGIVEGWLDMQWLRYLQRRNPNVPSLSSKLWAPPQERGTLGRQRRFWMPALEEGFRCIYSGEEVPPNDFALDHFLPWAWVGHDQLWNLVPVSRETNSEKGMRLPHADDIKGLADAHVRVIRIAEGEGSGKQARLDDYMSGLNLSGGDMADPKRIREAYVNSVAPQLSLASERGFQHWR